MTDPATIYEEWLVPAVFEPLAQQVLARTDVPSSARVLDVACGSGVVARAIARSVGPAGYVAGLDVSPAMLAAARKAAAEEGLTIEWQEGNAGALPFASGTFNLVFCQQGLQFFPDQARAVSEMLRVLVPGGRVAITTWRGLDRHPFHAAFDRAVRRRLNSSAIQAAFSLGDPIAVAMLLQDAGFRDVSVEQVSIEANYGKPDWFIERQVAAAVAAMPEWQRLPATERATLSDAIREDITEPMAQATFGDSLRLQVHSVLARGTRAG